jgi:hypothetical protein
MMIVAYGTAEMLDWLVNERGIERDYQEFRARPGGLTG